MQKVISPEPSTSTEKPKPSTWAEVISFVKTLIIIIVAALLIRGMIIEAFKIPSGSMRRTLLEGDHILVTKFNYGFWLPFLKETLYLYSSPARGDIVVFTRPDMAETSEDESGINIIKRVIGLPGDELKVRGTQVFINDQPLVEPYAIWVEGGLRDFGPEKVPEGKVFLMGDNRDQSKDSRFWEDSPYLDIHRIKGKALIIYWNFGELSRMGGLVNREMPSF